MKLYIRQKVFSWKDRFTIKDEAGQDRYTVEGELLSFGKRLHIYDAAGQERAFVRQKLMTWLPRFDVELEGRDFCQITKKFSFLRPHYVIDGLDWEIHGSALAHDYQVECRGRSIVSIHKVWLSWGDCYELDIEDPRDELAALATVLAIDCVLDAEAAVSASASVSNS